MKNRILAPIGTGALLAVLAAFAASRAFAQAAPAVPAQSFEQPSLGPALADTALVAISQLQGSGVLTPELAGRLEDRLQRGRGRFLFDDPESLGTAVTLGLGLAESTRIVVDGNELAIEFRGGETLAQIAAAKGISRDQVVRAFTASVDKEIEASVARSELTRAEADDLKAGVRDLVDQLLDTNLSGMRLTLAQPQ
jgi:hypothetical protein